MRVYGAPKNAAVKNPTDNSYRLLYCEESPESWFADYGEATLTNGNADVKLDPTFAALIHADTYHVFLTSHDPESKGLAIAGRRPDGFTVQEHASGTSGGIFSYRVVAKRKDIVGERLAKVRPATTAQAGDAVHGAYNTGHQAADHEAVARDAAGMVHRRQMRHAARILRDQ